MRPRGKAWIWKISPGQGRTQTSGGPQGAAGGFGMLEALMWPVGKCPPELGQRMRRSAESTC